MFIINSTRYADRILLSRSDSKVTFATGNTTTPAAKELPVPRTKRPSEFIEFAMSLKPRSKTLNPTAQEFTPPRKPAERPSDNQKVTESVEVSPGLPAKPTRQPLAVVESTPMAKPFLMRACPLAEKNPEGSPASVASAPIPYFLTTIFPPHKNPRSFKTARNTTSSGPGLLRLSTSELDTLAKFIETWAESWGEEMIVLGVESAPAAESGEREGFCVEFEVRKIQRD